MKILILGKTGQVSWELQRSLSTLGTLHTLDRENGDLLRPQTFIKSIREIKPEVIVNAAAYTAVDLAETEQAKAMAINGVAPGILAEEAQRLNALLVHYSTDYVFDGTAVTPYLETDTPDPINIYGLSKLQGEQAIQAIGGRYLILRTSWVYGTRGKNFLLTMLRLGKERPLLKVVNDQFGAPTWSRHIADATAHILKKCQTIESVSEIWGTYHLTASGKTSWYRFAEAIFQLQKDGQPKPELRPISTQEYPTPAKRPAFSVLNNEKMHRRFGIKIPDWLQGLQLAI